MSNFNLEYDPDNPLTIERSDGSRAVIERHKSQLGGYNYVLVHYDENKMRKSRAQAYSTYEQCFKAFCKVRVW